MAMPPTTTRGMRQVEQQVGMGIHAYLLDRYVIQQRSMAEIAAETGADKATISRWLKVFGITARYLGYRGRRPAA